MENENKVIFNVSGGQINIAKDSSTINAVQNNGRGKDELEEIVKDIMENIHTLDEEQVDEIVDMLELVRQELSKPTPKTSRLKNCLALIDPMLSIANGIPTLYSNLHKLQEVIGRYIS